MDNLECLSDVNIASKKLFLIQGDRPQLLNWERYGLRIGVSGGSLSSTETAEVAVVALVGGQFVFPKKTVLVSGVYAVSVSRPLLKALRLEIQHCVDITGKPALVSRLRFAIAPISTPNLPYHFSIVNGGEFDHDDWYGSINRYKFCLASIVGCTNGEGGGEGDEWEGEGITEEEEEEGGRGGGVGVEGTTASGSSVNIINTNADPIVSSDATTTEEDEVATHHIDAEVQTDNNREVSSNGIVEAMTYAGVTYYERDGIEDLLIFSAAKKLNALLQYIEQKRLGAKQGQSMYFSFDPTKSGIILKFDTPQAKPFTGWTIEPHINPCILRRCDIDNFGNEDYPIPPSCYVSVYALPGAVPILHYSIPLEGVVEPVSFFIHRALRTHTPVIETAEEPSAPALKQRKRKSHLSTDIKSITGSLIAVIRNNQVVLSEIFEDSLTHIALGLSAANIITHSVKNNPSYDSIIKNFITGLKMKSSIAELEVHCMDFLEALSPIGGPVTGAADMLRRKWTEETNLQLDSKRIKLS
ncbi:PREDICTED: uncharacterized protein LOC109589298 [Amphimedon queenslandica]|uniref:Uncharacterized protein n=1 Tax=Amphimedon queenslandica TaxID=400682 RepID=A0AAN0JVP5_AMPQE|nr:PREDICTED: uncharacterized protein LOC109589298 [Amphimedon queenslandica]|eukprot:XP_019860962.1 PREDICTED: uncharacterized protein LOC109589298 [Amphimedon queenslandica]